MIDDRTTAIAEDRQRSDGGIARAQQLDPLDPGDHEHLLRAVAYAMKRRHVEPGEVIANGVLASPWADDRDQWPGSDDRDQWPGPEVEVDAVAAIHAFMENTEGST